MPRYVPQIRREAMPLPLEGIRVIDWTLFQVGPFASAILADLGADVIHVEERGKGDLLRGVGASAGIPRMLPGGRHINFEEHNRNKRGIAVDLKKPRGREVIYRLAEKSDVFVTNFRADAAQRLGMDCDSLRKYNDRLIYALASGYGTRGPDALSPCVDPLGQARSGTMLASGEAGGDPILITMGIGDRTTSIYLAVGVLAAIIGRDRYGVAEELNTSILGSLIALQGWTILPALLLTDEDQRHNRAQPSSPLSNWYRCSDGRWIILSIMWQDRDWPKFCKMMDLGDAESDPRFSSMESRTEHSQELTATFDRIFKTKPSEEWLRLFRENDLLATTVNGPSEVGSDPQVLANNYITTWDHPTLGPVPWVNFPVEFSKNPVSFRLPAPEVGQHTEEVLCEIGYTWSDIEVLRDQEVI